MVRRETEEGDGRMDKGRKRRERSGRKRGMHVLCVLEFVCISVCYCRGKPETMEAVCGQLHKPARQTTSVQRLKRMCVFLRVSVCLFASICMKNYLLKLITNCVWGYKSNNLISW